MISEKLEKDLSSAEYDLKEKHTIYVVMSYAKEQMIKHSDWLVISHVISA